MGPITLLQPLGIHTINPSAQTNGHEEVGWPFASLLTCIRPGCSCLQHAAAASPPNKIDVSRSATVICGLTKPRTGRKPRVRSNTVAPVWFPRLWFQDLQDGPGHLGIKKSICSRLMPEMNSIVIDLDVESFPLDEPFKLHGYCLLI